MCGVVGMYGVPNALEATFEALFMVDHRGGEGQGAGVVVSDNGNLLSHHSPGSILQCQSEWEREVKVREALVTVGHLRYGTTGNRKTLLNVQPFVIESPYGSFCMAHNGDTPGHENLRLPLLQQGITFKSSADTEVLAQLIATTQAENLRESMLEALANVQSAFALVMATPNALIGCRDPRGYRPLSLARLNGGWILASETCAFDILHAEYVRDIEPGELVWIDETGLTSYRFGEVAAQHQQCVFELIYFSRPDSIVFERPVYEFRVELGGQLAREFPISKRKDILLFGIPDSAMFAAEGYSKTTGVLLEQSLIRHHRSEFRTFTMDGQQNRENGVRKKFNPIRHRLKDKECIIIDDSLVRGTTMRRLIRMLRQNGAAKITVLIASPPIFHPCRYGIDMKGYEELRAAIAKGDIEVIREFIEADDLYYLSHEGLQKIVGDPENFCMACFDGKYAF